MEEQDWGEAADEGADWSSGAAGFAEPPSGDWSTSAFPADSCVASVDHPPADDWGSGGHTGGGCGGGVADSAVAEECEVDMTQELSDWLHELDLSEYEEEAQGWCSENGAASLEEVAENLEDLAEVLPGLTALQRNCLIAHGVEALEALRLRSSPLREGAGCDGVLSSAPSTEASTAAPGPESGGSAGGRPSGSWAPGAGSFYARNNAGGQPAGSATAGGPGRWRGAAGTVKRTNSEGQDIQGFYDEQGLSAPSGDTDIYIQAEPSTVATWVPKAKVSQNVLKKLQKQHKSQQPGKTLSSRADVGQPDADAEERLRAEAVQRFQEQLEAEHSRRLGDAEDALRYASAEGDEAAFEAALGPAAEAGVDSGRVKEARSALARTLEERARHRESALAALRDAVQQPRTAGFGRHLGDALALAEDAHSLEGYETAKEVAEQALDEWRELEQRRNNAKMTLHMALRAKVSEGLRAALDEARNAGLDETSGDPLVDEAVALLEEVEASGREDGAATQRLEAAMAEEDLEDLELAIEACRARQLDVRAAGALLAKLQEEESRREAAACKLQQAIDAGGALEIRAALAEAREASVEAWLLEKAEACAGAAEVAAKRRKNASVELHLALNSKDVDRLRSAIAEAEGTGVEAAAVAAAQAELGELDEALRSLEESVKARAPEPLRRALTAAESLLSCPQELRTPARQALHHAKSLLQELEEEARRDQEEGRRKETEDGLRAAIERADWHAIVAGRARAEATGFQEDSELLQSAAAALEELREAHELEEAERIVTEMNAKLEELRRQENELVGPVHKKQRNAIGKKILSCRNCEDFVSSQRFLKNPEEERARRIACARELKKRAEEERKRLLQRQREALAELHAVLEASDEDAVRALLVEDILEAADVEAAEAFLSGQELRRKEAEKDAALCEFSFAGMDRRTLFQASVAINGLLTEKYGLQEGSDFKFKVVAASNSVFVAFCSTAAAEEVRATAAEAARNTAVVAQAEVRGPGAFSHVPDATLQGLRRDAEGLRARALAAGAAGQDTLLNNQAATVSSLGSRSSVGPEDAAERGGPRPLTAAKSTGSNDGEWSRVDPRQRGAGGRGGCSAGGPAVRSQTAWEGGRRDERGHNAYSGKGAGGRGGGGRGGGGGGGGPGDGAWGLGGGGRGGGGAAAASSAEEAVPLPRSAAAVLQRDQETARGFHEDLRMFAARFGVRAELQDGLGAVVVRPAGSGLQPDVLRGAREELRGLIAYYFPEAAAPTAPATAAVRATAGSAVSSQPCRQVHLVVDPERGAGLELSPTPAGFRVDRVEEYPGQELVVGETIVEIGGRVLAGLGEDEMEDAFRELFAHGAVLLVAPPGR